MNSVQEKDEQRKTKEFAIEAARLLSDRHCDEIKLLDVRGLSQVCDYVLVSNGTSDRQMKSVAQELESLGDELGMPAFRSNLDTGVTWIVVDFIDLVAHVFEPEHRDYYDLEGLWSDARLVAWEREPGAPAESASE